MLFPNFYSHEWIHVRKSAWSQYVPRRFGRVVLIQCWKWGRYTWDLLFRKHVSVKRRKERHSKPLPSSKSYTLHAAWYCRCISLKSRQVSFGSIHAVLALSPVLLGDKFTHFPSISTALPSLGKASLSHCQLSICQRGPFPVCCGEGRSDKRRVNCGFSHFQTIDPQDVLL